MKDKVKRWLENGTVDIFLGYRVVEQHSLPYCFTKEKLGQVDDLVIGSYRYPLEKIATHISARRPDIKIGILVRDCAQRALNVLSIWNQIDADKMETINVNCCPSNLKEHGDCSYLEPETTGSYKSRVGWDNNMDTEAVETCDQQERFSRWMYEFQKCIKCYGCRNICPVCFCSECSLEHNELVESGALPPEVPLFHLVRAVHMAGRCIDCGLCEDACPADIPLRLLYRKVNQIVKDVFDYETGTLTGQPPFSVLGDEVTLQPKSMATAQSNPD